MTDSGKLLVVDDDINNRDMLSRRLARRGYSVEVAGDGTEALEKLQKAQYDLVLLDQMMPGMSGIDLLRLLRATYSANDLPVIMVTAVDQSESIVDALHVGANDYVTKPVDFPVVAARIQTQLSRAQAEKRTKYTDTLTGLGNRDRLIERMSTALHAMSLRASGRVALLLINLDRFKALNDSFGHGAGDQCLILVAARLKAALDANTPTIARMGGDEFAVLIEDASVDQIEGCARAAMRCFEAPFALAETPMEMTASAGIAFTEDGTYTAQELLRDANLAVHHAKGLGSNRFEFFNLSLRERAKNRMRLGVDLRNAIEGRQLRVYYQPKVHLPTRAVVGFEALIRWQHPERGLIPPNDFIPVAEETGLIVPIGEWVLREAARQLKEWQGRFPSTPPLTMNVNLSVKQLGDPKLVAMVKRILAETELEPETLKLELTESSLITEIETARDTLMNLRSLGVGLKLDDFGTGYSSLSYLRTLNFDSLKIDRSFVNRMASDHDSRAIVNTIMNLAHTLNMNVVAEGIEDEDQMRELMSLGCDTGQGFLFSKPVTAEAAEKILQQEHAQSAESQPKT